MNIPTDQELVDLTGEGFRALYNQIQTRNGVIVKRNKRLPRKKKKQLKKLLNVFPSKGLHIEGGAGAGKSSSIKLFQDIIIGPPGTGKSLYNEFKKHYEK